MITSAIEETNSKKTGANDYSIAIRTINIVGSKNIDNNKNIAEKENKKVSTRNAQYNKNT